MRMQCGYCVYVCRILILQRSLVTIINEYRWFGSCIVTVILLLVSAFAQANEIPRLLRGEEKLLIVGVSDAEKPFSYRTSKRENSRIMPGYSGFMVEICRKVLDEMVSDDYFKGYRVIAKPVTAENRFFLLGTGGVDMLCGADSITRDRVERYTPSYPVFLSGVALVSRPAKDFPRTRYCQAVFGMVRGTTPSAASYWLEKLLWEADISRFKPALMNFLLLFNNTNPDRFRSSFTDSLNRWMESGGESGIKHEWLKNYRSLIDPFSVRTLECGAGFEIGPVVFYMNDQQGVESFCRGDTLFYIGDVELLKYQFDAHLYCNKVFQSTTLTKEAYGIYFRKIGDISEEYFSWYDQRDAVLYAQFNNILFKKMQDTENILEYEYKQEFESRVPSEDLKQLFRSFQYATDY